MKRLSPYVAVILVITLLCTSLPLMTFAATASDTLLACLTYDGGTAGADIPGDKSVGYPFSLGDATVHASVNGTDARKLEWTSDNYTHGSTSAVQPTMTAGSNNPWAVGAYIEVRLSTVGYTDLRFSAKLGGTKKGPRDFKLQYSTDGVSFTDVGVTYAITTNKEMQQAFYNVALPSATENVQTLFLRMTVCSDTLINGSTGLSGATGGETAVNDIVILASGEVQYHPQGDANLDGAVSSLDARSVLLSLIGGIAFTETQHLFADYNQDNAVDTADARAILLHCANLELPIFDIPNNGGSTAPTESSATHILLQGTTATVTGSGATVNGSIVTITDGGYYTVEGSMTDGQILVAADDTADDVFITLQDVTMSCSNSAPFFVQSADNTTLILADGTVNTFSDTANYIFADGTDEPSSPIYSKDDLIIEGAGTLIVNGNYNNGITSKDDLKFNGGIYDITAVNHGIRGKDSIVVKDGTFTINAGADGMQSDNTTDTTRGYVTIEDGTFNITAARDGIQAETALTINDGNFSVKTGGGSSTSPSSTDTESYKGLKAGSSITVTGGSITLDCKDDAIHSNLDVTLAGGVISAASGDDGVHADGLLLVNDPAALTVTKSYEAIEGVNITVTGGTMRLTASDDGINAAGGTDDNAGYWYVKDNLLYVVSESSNGYTFSLNTDISFDVNSSIYLNTDFNSTSPFDIVLDIESDNGSGSPALSTDWYPSFGYEATDVADGYLPATNSSVTAALDLKGYFDWNGTPTDGVATITGILVKLQGTGSICLGALQISDSDSITSFSLSASGSTLTAGAAQGNIMSLLDGIADTASSTSSSSSSGNAGNMGGTESTSYGSMTMIGGYIAVYASGDGVDINGDAVINGGTLIVHGPTDSGNAALDFDGTFDINGGIFIAAGASGMLQTPSSTSTQYILSFKSSSSMSAGTKFGIRDASGNTIVAFTPTKSCQSIIVSTPDIASGVTYTAYTGGTCSGSETDGLYDGSYSSGTSVGSATISSIITSIGNSSSSGNNRPTRP